MRRLGLFRLGLVSFSFVSKLKTLKNKEEEEGKKNHVQRFEHYHNECVQQTNAMEIMTIRPKCGVLLRRTMFLIIQFQCFYFRPTYLCLEWWFFIGDGREWDKLRDVIVCTIYGTSYRICCFVYNATRRYNHKAYMLCMLYLFFFLNFAYAVASMVSVTHMHRIIAQRTHAIQQADAINMVLLWFLYAIKKMFLHSTNWF